jgi:hypothetical protein
MSDKPSLSERLQAHVRRRKGELLRDPWIEAFREGTGIQIGRGDFLSLDATERLRVDFFARVRDRKPAEAVNFPPRPSAALETTLRLIALRNLDTPAVLLHASDEFIGAVTVQASAILDNAFRVWSITRHDLTLCTPTLADGFCLESTHVDLEGTHHSEDIYELTAWGKFVP